MPLCSPSDGKLLLKPSSSDCNSRIQNPRWRSSAKIANGLNTLTISAKKLHRKCLKDGNDYNKKEFSKQRHYCVSLVRKPKKLYYSNLDERKFTDNKSFWKTIKPFLSDKIVSREKLTLTEQDEIVESDIHTAQILDIAEYANCDSISDSINDPVIKSIVKYHTQNRRSMQQKTGFPFLFFAFR